MDLDAVCARENSIFRRARPESLDEIITKHNPEMTYVFGSRDYTRFIKRLQHENIRI